MDLRTLRAEIDNAIFGFSAFTVSQVGSMIEYSPIKAADVLSAVDHPERFGSQSITTTPRDSPEAWSVGSATLVYRSSGMIPRPLAVLTNIS